MHIPVLLEEVIKFIEPEKRKNVVDATLNGGGHSLGILEKYPDLKILGIEYDPDIFQKFQDEHGDKGVIAVNDSYVNLRKILKENNFRPDAFLFDLGLSSHHYGSGRGFSFLKEEMLDMRFNPNFGKPASEIVNTYPEKELVRIFKEYGEEQFADDIAKTIIKIRSEKPVLKTEQLVEIIKMSVPVWYQKRKIHPATKTFQALRIEANGEIENVKAGTEAAFEELGSGGRLLVISFHGIEDKLIREFFKRLVKDKKAQWVTRETIKPKWDEVKENPRARSAKMKIIEKI